MRSNIGSNISANINTILGTYPFYVNELIMPIIMHIVCLADSGPEFLKLFSKQRPSGPMLSISQNFRLFVSLSVRPSVHF